MLPEKYFVYIFICTKQPSLRQPGYIDVHSDLAHRLPGLSVNVYSSKQISHTFWKWTPVLQFPHLAPSLEGNAFLDFSEGLVNSNLANESAESIQEMRNSVRESPVLVQPWVTATSLRASANAPFIRLTRSFSACAWL